MEQFKNHPAPVPGLYRAVCTEVIDGDTIRVLIDLGFRAFTEETIRVKGVDTPELHTGTAASKAAGQAAKAFTALKVLNQPIRLVTGKDGKSFDRWVAAVSYPEGTGWQSLTVALINAGHGVSFMAD